MGRIIKGANGGFSGKAGSVVGSSWNGIDYIKGLPRISHKPASQKQLEQRARFSAVNGFLGPLGETLKIGWKDQTNGKNTSVNMAVQYALANSLTGTYPHIEVDPSLVLISKGNLGNLTELAVQSEEEGTLNLTWDYIPGDESREMDDAVTVVVYNPTQEMFISYRAVALRNEKSVSLNLPASFSTQEIHVYVFAVRRDDTKRSKSQHIGPVTVA